MIRSMRYSLHLLILAALVAAQPGCARKAPIPLASSRAARPVELLRADLDGLFTDPKFDRAQLGVLVFSLDRAEVIYERNARGLFIPASCNKLITAAVALLRLGPGFRFQTHILMDGQVEEGILTGDLVIVGSGDPSNSPPFQSGDPFATFRSWAATLKEKDIQAITGDIIGVNGAVGEPGLGLGWEWNDLVQSYAAPVSALQFNGNAALLEITPGNEGGSPASIQAAPLKSYLKIINRTTTLSGQSPADIRIAFVDSDEAVEVSGTVPLKGPPVTSMVSVRRPALYYIAALHAVLSMEGIHTGMCGIRTVEAHDSAASSLLWSHASPGLSEIIKPLMKNSLNLSAESLVRALGLQLRGEGTFAKGKEIVEETLDGMGVARGSYSYADGSGLSRLNLVSADALVRLLRFMYRDPGFQYFYDALPVAGVDGTLSERMKGTKAENNVRAKTGTLTAASGLAGFLRTSDGEMLAFAIGENNFLGPKGPVESRQDLPLERLAAFSRK